MANGLVMEIEPRLITELERKVPRFPIPSFKMAVHLYDQNLNNKAPTPAAIRNELDAIADDAIQLAARLANKSEELGDYLAIQEFRFGELSMVQRIIRDLEQLMGIAEMARRDVEQSVSSGRRLDATTKLVYLLADILTDAGLSIACDNKTAPLPTVLELALEAVPDERAQNRAKRRETKGGEPRPNYRAIAKKALDRRSQKQSD